VASQDLSAASARQQVRRYYLTYTSRATGTTEGPPSLASVQLEGNCVGAGNPAGTYPLPNNYEVGGQLPDPSNASACPRRPPVAFSYAAPQTDPTLGVLEASPVATPMPSISGGLKAPMVFDINNDGLPDVLDVGAASPAVWLNAGTNGFTSQPLALAGPASPGDLTKIDQLTPSASLATGAFQLDGRLDMMWGSIAKSADPSAAPCPQYGVTDLYCDNQVQYSMLNASSSNGQWTLTPALAGTYPLRPIGVSSFLFHAGRSVRQGLAWRRSTC
jgi:hypothetical protein